VHARRFGAEAPQHDAIPLVHQACELPYAALSDRRRRRGIVKPRDGSPGYHFA